MKLICNVYICENQLMMAVDYLTLFYGFLALYLNHIFKRVNFIKTTFVWASVRGAIHARKHLMRMLEILEERLFVQTNRKLLL